MAINTRKALDFIRLLRCDFADKGDATEVLSFVTDFINDDEIAFDPVAVAALVTLGQALNSLPANEPLSDERFAAASEVLSFADLLVVRRNMRGKVYDLRRKREGIILPDGNMVKPCPACGQGAIIFDKEISDHPETHHAHAIHVFKFETLIAFRVIGACCLEATQ